MVTRFASESNRHLATDAGTEVAAGDGGWAYRPQLDGLRALAVMAVAWSHWERPYQYGLPFGAGVHLFYVLSGFLITGILLRLRELDDKRTALTAFYIHRALRILPAFYAALLLAWLVDSATADEILKWHATFLTTVLIFSRAEWPGALSHFWSLAVEEQFYLVWPWLIVFAPRHLLAALVAFAILAAPLWRLSLASAGYSESLQGVLTLGSLDSLGVGALLAVTRCRPNLLLCALAPRLALWIAELLGAALPPWLVVTKPLFQAAVFGWLVLRASDGFTGLAGRLLASRPVVYLGKISYGVYLIHGLSGDILTAIFIAFGVTWPPSEPWRFVVICGSTIGFAALSWHVMERPINDLKRRYPYRAAAARDGSPRLSPAGIGP